MRGRILPMLPALLLPATLLLSCKKDDPAPAADPNGALVISGITINNFVPTDSTTLTGISNIQYLVPNSSGLLDTVKFTDTFTFATLTGLTKSYDLPVPSSTSQMTFRMEVIIGKGGTASNVTASNITFDYNGNNYLNSPIAFQGNTNYFATPIQMVSF